MKALPLGTAVAASRPRSALPAAAPASVRITRERVVLETAHARAVVRRAPFRLAVGTPGGRTVLREVPAGRGARPIALPVTDDPEPFAREDHPDHAVYAPLTFEVGRERIEQWQGSFWSGNLLRARRSGTVHRATRVLRAAPDGRGVRLVLATTDGRRRLVVRLGPDRGHALRVRARPVPARGVMTMADSFATAPGEAFHGFGGRHWGVDQRGRKLYGWTDQENFGGPMIKTLEPGLGSSDDERPAGAHARRPRRAGPRDRHGARRPRPLPLPERPGRRLLPAGALRVLAALRLPAQPARAARAGGWPTTAPTPGRRRSPRGRLDYTVPWAPAPRPSGR